METAMVADNYCFLGIQHWASTCMPRAEWSGWLQAVGSIAAIVAGAAAVWWQVHKQRRHTLEEEVRRLRIISALSYTGSSVINLSGATLDAERALEQLNDLDRLLDTLTSIPLLEVPDWNTSQDIMALGLHRDRIRKFRKDNPDALRVAMPRFLLDIYRMLLRISVGADSAITRRRFQIDRRDSLPDDPSLRQHP